MMHSNRNELLSLIARIGELAPDFRLGQLIALLTDRSDTAFTVSPIADIEDEELVGAAKAFLETLEARHAAEADPASSTLSDRLAWMVGSVSDLPADFSLEHDHYIHGTPRRSEESKAS